MEKQFLDALAKMQVGESVVTPLRKGWMLRLTKTEDGFDAREYNPTDGGGEKFFATDTAGDAFGAPRVFQEPSLSILLSELSGLIFDQELKLGDTLVGAIVLDDAGKVIGRFSFSGVVYFKKQSLELSTDGSLIVNGENQGKLAGIFMADKNRMIGYVGVFTPAGLCPVKVVEMETMAIASILG